VIEPSSSSDTEISLKSACPAKDDGSSRDSQEKERKREREREGDRERERNRICRPCGISSFLDEQSLSGSSDSRRFAEAVDSLVATRTTSASDRRRNNRASLRGAPNFSLSLSLSLYLYLSISISISLCLALRFDLNNNARLIPHIVHLID